MESRHHPRGVGIWTVLAIGLWAGPAVTAAAPPEVVLPAEASNIVTVAGGGTEVDSEPHPAVAAKLSIPSGVGFDSLGDLYVAETSNLQPPLVSPSQHRIRKVDRTTGIMTTVVGKSGVAGAGGDGFQAVDAQVNGPVRVLFDPDDNMYVMEASGHRVRKVDRLSGIITRVIGTGTAGTAGDGMAAADAQLAVPRGLALDAAGSFYVSDTNNNRIRKVTGRIIDGLPQPLDGSEIIDPFAGDVVSPRSIELDADENLIVADLGNNRIRLIDAQTRVASTLAGDGGMCPEGPASCGDGLLATAAQITGPTATALDASGNLFIIEAGRIRRVDAATQIISRVAGDRVVGFAGDGDLAIGARFSGLRGGGFDSGGNLHIADAVNNRIRRLNLDVQVHLEPAPADLLDASDPWITATLQLPAHWDAARVNLASIRLQAIDPATAAVRFSGNQVLEAARAPGAVALADTNGDGMADQLTVAFARTQVAAWAGDDGTLVLRVEGQFQPVVPGHPGRFFSGDSDADYDLDLVADGGDDCLLVANPDQLDTDGDGGGDACDVDDDGDGLLDASDDRPTIPGASRAYLKAEGLGLCATIAAVSPGRFNGPNLVARIVQRTLLSLSACDAGWLMGAGNTLAARVFMTLVTVRVDGKPAIPDWMNASSEKAAILSRAQLFVSLPALD